MKKECRKAMVKRERRRRRRRRKRKKTQCVHETINAGDWGKGRKNHFHESKVNRCFEMNFLDHS